MIDPFAMMTNTSSYSTRLDELIQQAFSEPADYLSGKGQSETLIGWVSLSAEDSQKGDLLILPYADLSSEIIALCEGRGVGAILLLGRPPKKSDPIKSAIPILISDRADDLRTAHQKLLGVLTNQRAAYIEQRLRIHSRLSKISAGGEKIEGLARAMHEITGRGILIQDKRLNVITEFPSPDLDSIWEDIKDQLGNSDALPDSLQDRAQASHQSAVSNQKIAGGIARIISPIIVGEVARGYLSILGMEGDFDVLDQAVAEEGALICAIEMSRTKAVRETVKRLQGDLLTALIQEDLSPRDAGLWIQTMGLDPTKEHVAMQFTWNSPSPPSLRRLETIVNGEIVRLGATVILNPTGSNVICFCQVSPGESRPEIAIELGESILAQANAEYPEAKVRCGIGTAVNDLNKWQISFREAGHSLEMACRLDEDKPMFYPDLSVYRLLLLIENHPELEEFHEGILGRLLSHDGGDNFINTLEEYFSNNAKLSQTAKALFIHRNTLTYRIQRIEKITGLNLDNPDHSLAIQLALRINQMR